MTGQTDEDVPGTGAIFTFGQSRFADNVPSKFWLKNDRPVQISCGGEHTAVITGNGRLLMFGVNTWGQLGLGPKPAARKPVSVKALKSEKVKLAACGQDHTIVCTWRGDIYCVGSNQEGQLGLGHCNNTPSFELLPPFCDYAPIKMLSAGYNTSAALTEDGRLFVWGDNSVGQIGLGDQGFAAQPTRLDVGQAVIWVSCGYRHSAFVTVDGSLYTFGESAYGRLGLQEEQLANHRVPQPVQDIVGRVTQVSCGGEHTVALTDENVYTFGRGQHGQLGHGTFLFEVDLPKPLEHFSNSSVRHVACGESHTAVITSSGLLYTFGDGRHGKLGLAEENFINQFSPTLCTRFFKYDVQLVSCGGNHMLVLAAPRLPEAQEVPERNVAIGDMILDPSYTEISLIGPASLVPLSALQARARHREKESATELFGKMFQNLPHLHSGFLSTSWSASRNILTPKTLSKNIASPSSSPRPQSVMTPSTPLSPRSPSKASHSPLFPSVPSSPRSQSSHSTSKSKPKELPSSLLLPKSNTKRNSPVSPVKTRKHVHRVVTAKATLHDKVSSAQSPVEPCSPSRPPTHVSYKRAREEEHPALPQTAGESSDKQVITEDRKEKRGGSKMEKRKALPTELLKVSSSLKTKSSPLKVTETKTQVTSKGKENITHQSLKTKTREDKQYQKDFSHVKSSKDGKAKQELGPKTAHSAHETRTEAQAKVKTRNLSDTSTDRENAKYRSDKTDLMGPLEKTQPAASVKNRSAITSISVQSGRPSVEEAKEEAYNQSKTTDAKPVKSEVQQEMRRVESTSAQYLPKVKSIADKGQSKTVNVKSLQVKNAPGDETSQSLRSSSVKVKGKRQHVTSTLIKNQSKPDKNAKRTKEGNFVETELKLAKNSNQKMKAKPADKQTLAGADSITTQGQKKARETQLMGTAKPGGEQREEIKIKEAANADSKSDKKPKVRKRTDGNAVASHSPKKHELGLDARTKSLQSSEPVEDLFVSESDRDDAKQKPAYGEILTNIASLLPAAAVAGSAVGLISQAVTSIQSLQSDNDSATSTSQKGPKQKLIMKQSAIMQPSFSSTLTDFTSSPEASDPPGQSAIKDAQVKSGKSVEGESSNTEDQEEHEEVDTRSSVEDEEESRESSDEKEEQSASEEAEQEKDNETDQDECEEKTSSSSEEEDEASEKGDATEAEEEEEESEESSGETGESESDSELNEAAEDKEESESEKSSRAESNKDVDESEMSEDEEDKSSDESESTAGSRSEAEEEEEEGEESGTSQVDEEEEEEEDSESEEQKDDQDSTETEDEEKSSEEDEEDENEEGDDDETAGETSDETEEEEEHSESDKEEDDAIEHEDDGESEEEEENSEKAEEKEDGTEEEEEEEEVAEDEEEGEEEEEDKEEVAEEEEEEEEEKEEEGEEEEEEEEEGEEEEEEEESLGEEEQKTRQNKKSMGANKKAMTEEEEEEEEEEVEDSDEEKHETPIKPKTEKRLQQREERKIQQSKGNKGHDSEQSEDESEEEEEEEGEDDDEEEEEEKKADTKVKHGKKLVKEEQENETDQTEEEEEEGEKEDEEEEEEAPETVKSTKQKQHRPQKLPPKEKQLKEAPKPAPRAKQRAAGGKQAGESQQFWDNVLPQYLDLQ